MGELTLFDRPDAAASRPAAGAPMPAITLHQPWASLIAVGLKTSETRSWAAPRKLWGKDLRIHAGKHIVPYESLPCGLVRDCHDSFGPGPDGYLSLPRGAVVATARLKNCVQVFEWTDDADGQPRALASASPTSSIIVDIAIDGRGDYSVGRWVWQFGLIERLAEPIPARGYQGIWTLKCEEPPDH